MLTTNTLTWTVDADGIAVLTLNRPEALNAFNAEMAQDLIRIFGDAATDDSVRAIVVTGAGRTFCAGMDLSPRADGGNVFGVDETLAPTPESIRSSFDDPAYQAGVVDTGGQVSLAINRTPKPVIAAINGPAVGIGATMTLAMDVRMISTVGRIGFVFGRLGIVPEAASSWFLPRIVGLPQALEWIYSAEVVEPDSALSAKLVRSIHEPDDLLPSAVSLARQFVTDRSPTALGLAKQLLYEGSGAGSPSETHLADSLAFWHTATNDGKEGVAAFLEKRRPLFKGRASRLPRITLD